MRSICHTAARPFNLHNTMTLKLSRERSGPHYLLITDDVKFSKKKSDIKCDTKMFSNRAGQNHIYYENIQYSFRQRQETEIQDYMRAEGEPL